MAADIKHVHGKQACSCQVKTLEMIESRLRAIGAIKQDLSRLITQQAFSTDVKASGGTHDGGGVWDVKFTVVDTIEKRRAWRESGAWATFRTKDQGPWPDHGHVNGVGCPHMSEPAKRQVKKYRRGLNGLKGDGPDQAPRLKVVTWEQALAAFNQPKAALAKPKRVIDLVLLVKTAERHLAVGPSMEAINALEKDKQVDLVQAALNRALGSKLRRDGRYGPATRRVYTRWQEAIGFTGDDADGKPARKSLKRLGDKSGLFTVKV